MTGFIHDVTVRIMAEVICTVGRKGYTRLQKVSWKTTYQSIKKIPLKRLFARDELTLLNLNAYSKQESIWQQLEALKKIMQAYPIERFLKNFENNPFIKIQPLTSTQLCFIYAGAVAFADAWMSGKFRS